MIEIYLYGDLRHYAPGNRASGRAIIALPAQSSETIAALLRRAGIPQAEVAQVFLNGQLLTTACSMAPYLGYVTAQARVPADRSPWETELRDGDRLGLFPARMCMLVV